MEHVEELGETYKGSLETALFRGRNHWNTRQDGSL